MGTIKRFEDIVAWQKARMLADKIYSFATAGTFERDFKLREQINGSSGSIMDNIAEGFERDGRKEFILFLSYAKGSCGEVKSQLYRAKDRKHIPAEIFDELYQEADAIAKMIGGLMKYLGQSQYEGNKFKEPFTPYGNQIAEPEFEDNALLLSQEINDITE